MAVNSVCQLLKMFLSLRVVFLSVAVAAGSASNPDQTGKTTPVEAAVGVVVSILGCLNFQALHML